MTEQELTEPWDGYDDAHADELIDAATRKRSEDRLHDAVEYEKANKNRVTVIEAFEARLSELDGDSGSLAEKLQGTADRQAQASSAVSDQAGDGDPRGDVPASKGQPGEIKPGDAVTPASADDVADRQSSGQVAAAEADARIKRDEETNEKAQKAAADGGLTPVSVGTPTPVYAAENRQDRIELAGHEYRVSADVDADPGYQFDATEALNADPVDHFAVASTADGLYLEIDGQFFRFDRQMGTALGRIVQAGQVAIHS